MAVVLVAVVGLLLVAGVRGTDGGRPLAVAVVATPEVPAFALPPSIDGRLPLAEADVSPVAADVAAVFARDFDHVVTRVYGERGDRDAVFVLLGDRRSVVPADFVRDFAPKAGAPEHAPAGNSPGTDRCWSGGEAGACLWGDNEKLLYVGSIHGVEHTAGLLERILRGAPA
ncbi:hypothetical protein [Yinghuangia sp. YIM S10712]|uniref:hypothetical protein n=1 Tax=Yinghuangia sp. YIM S10712 TaxID=3436930 RepID=UPI003F5333BC